MKKILALLAALAAFVLPEPAAAQTGCTYIVPGAVLTAAQWQACFQQKADFNTAGNLFGGGTMTGKLTFIASNPSTAGINLPQGVAPSTPLNGDIWTTNSGLFAYINGATQGPYLSATTVVTSIAGTAGQINASAATGSVTLSLPATITPALTFSGTVNFTGTAELNGVAFGTFATANFATPPAIGGTTPAAGSFTTLSASSTVSGAGFSSYLASPPAIGGTTASSGRFTTLTATTSLTLNGSSSGSTTVQAAAAAGGTITVPNATDQLVARATTDTLTNKTFDTAGAGNIFRINGSGITAISGNTATVATSSGTLTPGDCVSIGAGSNIIDAGGPCTTGGGGGTVNPGTAGQLPYYATSTNAITSNPNLTISGSTFTVGVAGSAGGTLRLAGSTTGNLSLTTSATTSGTATFPANTGTVAELNIAQSWTAAQTFANSGILLLGSSTGATTLASANSGASNFTLTLPARTDTVAELGAANAFTGNNTFGGTSVFNGTVTVQSVSFGVQGAQNASAWTTNGLRYANVPATLTDTSTATSGTVTTTYNALFGGNTNAATNTSVTYTNLYDVYFEAPVAGSNITVSNGWALGADNAQVNGVLSDNAIRTLASASGLNLDDVIVQGTTTLTGTTTVTALSKVHLARPTITDSSAVTVTTASTLTIDNCPLAAGSVTISNCWALNVPSGAVNFGGNLTTNVTGSTQCLQVNSSGVVSGFGAGCNPVTTVSNSDGTLTISPTTGAVVASLALGHANTWTGVQSYNSGDLALKGSTSGTLTVQPVAAAGTNTITLPGVTDTVAVLGTADQTVAGGANVTAQSLSTGNVTIDCGSRPLQFITSSTSAWTITAPAHDGSCMVLLSNVASAVNPSFSGFSPATCGGATLTTVSSSKFTISIWRINGTSGCSITANQ